MEVCLHHLWVSAALSSSCGPTKLLVVAIAQKQYGSAIEAKVVGQTVLIIEMVDDKIESANAATKNLVDRAQPMLKDRNMKVSNLEHYSKGNNTHKRQSSSFEGLVSFVLSISVCLVPRVCDFSD